MQVINKSAIPPLILFLVHVSVLVSNLDPTRHNSIALVERLQFTNHRDLREVVRAESFSQTRFGLGLFNEGGVAHQLFRFPAGRNPGPDGRNRQGGLDGHRHRIAPPSFAPPPGRRVWYRFWGRVP